MNVQTTTFAIGDRIRVPVRFGETGVIVEINKKHTNPYGVKFKNLDMTLFYNAEELRPLGPKEKGFCWFRMPNHLKSQVMKETKGKADITKVELLLKYSNRK
jgi:hypothetical protein